jgi:putative intracellular protease/amidase
VRVDITVFDGLDEMDALGPLEVFRSAQRRGADIDTRLVTFSKVEKVRGTFGLRFRADAVYVAGEADVLVVVGGGWASRSDVGAWGSSNEVTGYPSLPVPPRPVD